MKDKNFIPLKHEEAAEERLRGAIIANSTDEGPGEILGALPIDELQRTRLTEGELRELDRVHVERFKSLVSASTEKPSVIAERLSLDAKTLALPEARAMMRQIVNNYQTTTEERQELVRALLMKHALDNDGEVALKALALLMKELNMGGGESAPKELKRSPVLDRLFKIIDVEAEAQEVQAVQNEANPKQ